MRTPFFILMLLSVAFSCSSPSSGTSDGGLTGRWELVRMTGSMAGSETTGSDMTWQESYTFSDDGTFVKDREGAEGGTTARGTYTVDTDEGSGQTGLVLDYKEGKNLVGTCSPDRKERLYLQSRDTLYSTWMMCDGPGLEYKKSGQGKGE